jgi:hypothetical protein
MSILRNWKTILGLLALFAAGVIVGGVLTLGAVRKIMLRRADPDTWAPRTLAWFHDEMHTTPEQESQLRPIIDRGVADMVKLRDEGEEHWRSIVGSMIVEAAPILTDTQREEMRDAIRRAQDKKQLFGGSHLRDR